METKSKIIIRAVRIYTFPIFIVTMKGTKEEIFNYLN
jgi:hypothetical protein